MLRQKSSEVKLVREFDFGRARKSGESYVRELVMLRPGVQSSEAIRGQSEALFKLQR